MTDETEGVFGDTLTDGLKGMLADCIVNETGAGLIYYIASPETRRIKIGYTRSDPTKRLRALQTGSPTPLCIMAVHPGDMEHERFLHNYFVEANLRGEWFDADDAVFECISYVCWATAFAAINKGRAVPSWAQIGLDALEEWVGEPLPLPVIGETIQ